MAALAFERSAQDEVGVVVGRIELDDTFEGSLGRAQSRRSKVRLCKQKPQRGAGRFLLHGWLQHPGGRQRITGCQPLLADAVPLVDRHVLVHRRLLPGSPWPAATNRGRLVFLLSAPR